MPTATGRKAVLALVVMAGTLAACSPGRNSGSSVSALPTARFTIQRYTEGAMTPVGRFEGLGDFVKAEEAYTLYLSGKPFMERLIFGNVTYSRRVGEDVWEKGEDATTPEAKALISIRNTLLDPKQSIGYLRSIADSLVEIGVEDVRATRTTHYRATVDLGRAGGPAGRTVTLDVWAPTDERVRRLRYSPLGSTETLVWEFYDFGVAVDLVPPPPDEVR